MAKGDYAQTDVPGASDQQDAVDWSVLESLAVLQKPGAPDLRTRLITIYLKSSLGLMEGIKTAFITGNAPLLATSAHALKSSSLSLGAIRLGTLCAALENIGRANEMHDVDDLANMVEEHYAAVTAVFRDALGQGEK